MVSKELIAKNKELLLKEHKRLEALLSRVAKRDPVGGDFYPAYPEFGNKEDENASEVATYEEHVAEEFDLAEKLKKVEAALQRIADGTYGRCLGGGEEIPTKRLLAVPEAESCVKHAA